MMEADFKAIWNLPFFVCPYLKHRIFHLPYYHDFFYPSGYFFHKSCGVHN